MTLLLVRTVEVPCNCTKSDLTTVQYRWKCVTNRLTVEQKVSIFESVLQDIAQYDAGLAQTLRDELLREANNYLPVAAQLFIDLWDNIIRVCQSEDELKAKIRSDALARIELARAFYGHAPLIARSLVT